MPTTLWTVPFPSSSGHTSFYNLPKRNCVLVVEGVMLDGDAEGESITLRIVFESVEAYKCTYYRARTPEMRIAYDRLVDLGDTTWLAEVKSRLSEYDESLPGSPPQKLRHLMINFDDGPCYEFICPEFHVDQIPAAPGAAE